MNERRDYSKRKSKELGISKPKHEKCGKPQKRIDNAQHTGDRFDSYS
jgi:hypothetical protein